MSSRESTRKPIVIQNKIVTAPQQGNLASKTINTSSRMVVLMVGLSFLIFVLSGPSAQAGITYKLAGLTRKGTTAPAPSTHYLTQQNAINWAIILFILIVMTDIPLTEKLATAFSVLIFVSTAVALGPAALDTITGISGTNSTAPGKVNPKVPPPT